MARLVKDLDRRQLFAAVAQIPVRVVLQDEHVVLAAQFSQPLPPFSRQRLARRVVEGRNDIDHLGMVFLHLPLCVVGHDAVFVRFHGDAMSLKHFKNLDAVDKGRRFDEDDVARIDDDLTEKVHRFQAAVDDHDVVRFGMDALRFQEDTGHDVAQILQADGIVVLQRFQTALVPRQHVVCNFPHDIDGQGLHGRRAAAEGNYLRIGHGAE